MGDTKPADTEPQIDAVDKANEDADRAAFDRIMAKAGGGQPESEDTQADEEVKTTSEKAESVQDDNDKDSEGAEPQPDLSALVQDKKVAKYVDQLGLNEDKVIETAVSALKRDGVLDDEEITAMLDKDPAKFLEKGLKRAKAQKDQDQFGSEYRKYLKQQEESAREDGGKDAESGVKDDAPSPAETPAADANTPVLDQLDEVLSPLREDELYADLVDPLKGALSAMLKNLEASRTQDQGVIQALQNQIVERELADQRASLSDRFPDLEDEAAYERVLTKYDDVVATGKFNTVAAAFEEAAKWELGEASAEKIKDRLRANSKQRKAGQPRAKTGNIPDSPETGEESERRIFNRLASSEKYAGMFSD